jgi:hypothetical protein
MVLYFQLMKGTTPIPIRLSAETIRRLESVAETTHLGDRSAVMKLCILSFLDFIEANKITTLPVDWRTILEEADGRRKKKQE